MTSYADIDEATLIAHMRDELAALPAGGVQIRIDAARLLELAGLVQLAVRHPRVADATRSTAAAFLDGVRAAFTASPAIREVLARGDDPTRWPAWPSA